MIITYPDPLYKYIEISDEEKELLCSPIIRRLHFIKQKGLSYLFFPGARHTRLEHSLGVLHLCDSIGKKCGLNQDELRILRLAAMFHDVGHGPYSHLTERLLWRSGWQLSHESISAMLVKEKFADKLPDDALAIADIIDKKYTDKRLPIILSGTIDADRIDYVLRDIYNAGLPYRIIHLEPLLNAISIDKDGAHIDLKTGLDFIEIEPVLLLRDYMKWYIDKDLRCRSVNSFVIKAIESMAKSEKSNFFSDLRKSTDPKSLRELPRFSGLTDYSLFCELQRGNSYCHAAAEMISKASCFGYVAHLYRNQIDQTLYSPIVSSLTMDRTRSLEDRLEQEIEKNVGISRSSESSCCKMLVDIPRFEQEKIRPADLTVRYPELEMIPLPLSYNLTRSKSKEIPFKSLPMVSELLERTQEDPICLFCNDSLGLPTKNAIAASFLELLRERNKAMDEIIEGVRK